MSDVQDYDDAYPTCGRTYATLAFYHDTRAPNEVTEALSIVPTRTQIADQAKVKGQALKPSAWFLTSRDSVQSLDVRRHIDFILAQLDAARDESWKSVCALGWRPYMSCFWLSKSGHGGPRLSPKEMARMAELGLEIDFDIYGAEPDERPLLTGETTHDFNRLLRHWSRNTPS